MRKIGSVSDAQQYRLLRFYFYQQGIELRDEEDEESSGEIWVLRDTDIPKAKQLLNEFLNNPDDPKYRQLKVVYSRSGASSGAQKSSSFFTKKKNPNRGAFIDVRTQIFNQLKSEQTPVNISLILLSVLVFLGMGADGSNSLFGYLAFSRRLIPIEIFSEAQIWRVFTPMFVHFGLLHILFNVIWLYQIGGEVERFLGSRRYLLLVLGISGLSNSLFYLISGPSFGGLSGVVYGLATYCFVMNYFGTRMSFSLHPNLVQFFLWWHVICCVLTIVGGLSIANSFHAMGPSWGMCALWHLRSSLSPGYYKRLLNDVENQKRFGIALALVLFGMIADMSASKGILFYWLMG